MHCAVIKRKHYRVYNELLVIKISFVTLKLRT